ncbi:NHLP bacteriocin export ABC transporter permease/ATPase subunit [Methanoplanus endosymbiosus]|uniref:NHLP bacteriocin export ABC transporter permease/ATPase subunit n=1 Tax=Methanoplanus endosymbiosus TaxID=33865 RepID=A0A9E7PMV3_9EURY|nr:NHLP bacteriocin export ABC transporter permease/ATPase subunit [Methanoplanus endosymbiosus]UUX93158.1 NHLP bacteriocin export ABC transporter permease/ATPase subunit [Methanoplanus endosymbiosus]
MNSESDAVNKYKTGEEVVFSNPSVCYRVVKGSLIVYITQHYSNSWGRHLPGLYLEPGESVFGFIPGNVGLTAVFQTYSEIEETDIENLDAPSEDTLRRWAEWIGHPLLTDNKQSYPGHISLKSGIKEITEGQQIRFNLMEEPFLLCRVTKGTLRDTISDMTFTDETGIFPVLSNTVLYAASDVSLEILLPETETINIDITLFNSTCREWMLSRVTARSKKYLNDEEKRINAWITQEEEINERIIHKSSEPEGSNNPLWPAFSRVLREIGIPDEDCSPPKQHAPVKDEKEVFTELIRMAEHSGVRIRRVGLTYKWWKEDCGPLLVTTEDGTMLAAIADRPGRYTLYSGNDPVAKNHEAGNIALSPTAYMLYPTFPDRKLSFTDIFMFLYRAVWKRDILFLLVFGMIAGVLTTAIPLATGLVFNNAIPHHDYPLFQAIILVLFMSVISSALFQLAREIATIRMEGRIGSVFEGAVWDRLLKLPPSFFRNYNSGDLALRAGIVDEIRELISGVTVTVLFGAVFSVFNIILMFAIYPDVALYSVLLVGGFFLLTVAIGYISVRYRQRMLDLRGHLGGVSFQILSGITKITAAGAQNRAYVWWEKEFKKQMDYKLKVSTCNAYIRVLTVFWPGLLTILVFALTGSALSVVHPDQDHGWFLAFYAAVGAFSVAFTGLAEASVMMWNVRPMWDWIKPIITSETEVNSGHISPGVLSGAVELNHVSFRYSQNSPLILDDVSISVNPGEFVAIVGQSGSGKSTLLRILLGFERPFLGSVVYDQKRLANLNVREVRKQIGVVIQDESLMSDSILNNIAGSRSISMEEAWEAAEMAGIDEDIREMPMQMHTIISEGSGNISGGQKQRILIARAIAFRPGIMFLDEATSALDNTTQKKVMESLKQLNLTRIVIAHRLSSIKGADRIYVLDKGKIAEAGTYEELIQKGGIFSDLARHQLI